MPTKKKMRVVFGDTEDGYYHFLLVDFQNGLIIENTVSGQDAREAWDAFKSEVEEIFDVGP